MKNLVGRTLDGKVTLNSLLGEGGMGAVYRARQLHFDREVAVKVLKPQFCSSEDLVRRFYREAKAAGRLRSRHVISIYDYGRANEGAYIIMELSNGVSLAELITRNPRMPAGRAVAIASQVLSALQEAHQLGIIHRDLKTENVLVERDYAGRDFALVLDFGIAKLSGSFSVETAMGAIFGTPSYMAPEQCMGEVADARTDLYAIGVMLYELMAGTTPFGDRSATDLIIAHIRESPIDLRRFRPDLSDRLVSAVMKLLQKKRDDRFQAAELALVELLASIAPDGSPHATTAAPPRPPLQSFEDTIAEDYAPPVDAEAEPELVRKDAEMTDPPSPSPARAIDLELVPVLAPGARAPATLSPEEWNVVARIGGSRSIREIAREAGLEPVQAAERLRSMIGRGMLRLEEPSLTRGAQIVPRAALDLIAETLTETLGPVSQLVVTKELAHVVPDGERLRFDQLEPLLERVSMRVKDAGKRREFLRIVRDALEAAGHSVR